MWLAVVEMWAWHTVIHNRRGGSTPVASAAGGWGRGASAGAAIIIFFDIIIVIIVIIITTIIIIHTTFFRRSCGWFEEGDERGYHEIRISTDLVMVNPNKGFKWHQVAILLY